MLSGVGKSSDRLRMSGLLSLSNPLPMWVYDLETLRILAVNPAALTLYGYTREEFLRRRVTDLWASTGVAEEKRQRIAPETALPLSVTQRQRRKDGTLIDVHILAHPLMFRSRSAVLAVAQDVTKIGSAEEPVTSAPVLASAGMETLVALNQELSAARTVEEVYAAVTTRGGVVARAAHASFALLTPDRQALTLAHTAGVAAAWPDGSLPTANSWVGWVLHTGHPFFQPPPATEPSPVRVDDAVYRAFGPVALIRVGPSDDPIGVLIVARARHPESTPFTRAEIGALQGLADIGAATIQRIHLIRRLQHACARTVLALARAVEAHGGDQEGRAARLVGLAAATAGKLGASTHEVEDVRWAARLYDIGMVAVPSEIALKPDPLTEPEWEVVRRHPVVGEQILQSVEQLHRAATLVRHHQERWDGSGYPDGLGGEQIPLGARILGVLEAYAAMSEPRPYRPARAHDEVIAELRRGAGVQFDPRVVEAFCAVTSQRPGRSLDATLSAALHALPDGARQLVRMLEIEEIDLEVEEHLARVGRWSVRLAAAAGVPPERRRLLAQAALLHDVGKLGVSRTLLRKPGALSSDDRARIVQHVGKGVALLRALDVNPAVVDLVAAHHERWDGTGYPRGLAGDAIPLEARILAVADSFDAMTTERVYQRARTLDEAAQELRREAGAQFEARLIDLFLAILQETDRGGL